MRQVSGDPVTLHWEDSKNTPDPYAKGKRFATNGVKAGQRKKSASEDLFEITQSSSTLLNRLFTQLQNDVSADGLRSVGIYACIRQQSVPDDLYKFDYETRELVAYPWENAKLKKTRMEALVKAFADGNFIEEAPITLFFTAVLDRAVWRFKEAAYRETFRVLKKGGTFCGCFYVRGGCGRTDWMINHLYQPKGYFTPPYETEQSLRERLERMYTKAKVTSVEGIACFRCMK